ncbi:MAG: ATP-grasp domain-containing protein [Patescibacteria group bacterium]
MSPLRVAVLRGGPSPEYDVSLRTGAYFLKHLAEAHHPQDIFITRSGEWFHNGVPTAPERLFPQIDVALSALHGAYGEDGKLQRLFDEHGVRYVGSGALPSALAMQKHLSSDIFKKAGLRTPRSWSVRVEDLERLDALTGEIRRAVAPPWVVKPSGSGSSLGLEYVWDPHKLGAALERAFFLSEVAVIEEYIRGEEVTVLILEGFRGQDMYAFFPVHIQRQRWELYTTEHKREGSVLMECPSRILSFRDKELVAETARAAHKALSARDLSRADIIVNPTGAYLLEVNTLPSFGDHTPAGMALRAAGLSDLDLCSHLVERAASRS